MPATVIEDPLAIDCVFSDGTTARFDLDGVPNPGWLGTCWWGWWS